MDLLGVAWHVLDFLAPAAGVGMIGAAMMKLVWRRELPALSWWRSGLLAAGASAVVLVAGLVVFGRDGKMSTYAAMIVASAVALWWAGFGRRR